MIIEHNEEFDASDEPRGNLISRMGRRTSNAAQRYLFAGVGAVAVAAQKSDEFRHEKVEKGIDRLASRGRQVRDNRLQALGDNVYMLREMVFGTTRQIAGAAVNGVTGVVRDKAGIAGAADVERVAQQIDDLNERLDQAATAVAE